MEGNIDTQDDLFVDGEVVGNLIASNHKITMGPNANVKGKVKAKNVALAGNLEGNIEATERIELCSNCGLLGDARGPRIVVEDGARIKGTLEVVRESPA